MNVDCEHCGHSNKPPAPVKCGKCGESFSFFTDPVSEWEPWDYSKWLFAHHFQIVDLAYAKGWQALPRSLQLNYLVGYFYYQFLNGGLPQYLMNPCGPDAPELVDALREVEAPQTADVVAQLLRFFPDGRPPLNQAERDDYVMAIPDDVLDQLGDLATHLVNEEDTPEDLLVLLHRRITACQLQEAAS